MLFCVVSKPRNVPGWPVPLTPNSCTQHVLFPPTSKRENWGVLLPNGSSGLFVFSQPFWQSLSLHQAGFRQSGPRQSWSVSPGEWNRDNACFSRADCQATGWHGSLPQQTTSSGSLSAHHPQGLPNAGPPHNLQHRLNLLGSVLGSSISSQFFTQAVCMHSWCMYSCVHVLLVKAPSSPSSYCLLPKWDSKSMSYTCPSHLP